MTIKLSQLILQKILSPLKDRIFEYLKYNSNPNDSKNFDGTRYSITEKKTNA